MTDNDAEHNRVDPGNLNAILAAVEMGWRDGLFPIPHKLRPSQREVEARPVERRRAMIRRRLLLRRTIDRVKTGFRTRTDLKRLSRINLTPRGKEIVRKAQSFRKLFTKDFAGETWARLLSDDVTVPWATGPSGFAARLVEIEKRVSGLLLDDQMVIDEIEQSALDWLVLRLADVFKRPLGEKATTAYNEDSGEYYSPFISFVLEIAKELEISIEPSTIHRIMSAKSGMGRRTGKK